MYNNILEAIGNTPLIRINRLNPNERVIMYGKHEVEDEEVVAPTGDGTVVITNSDDSDFAVGFYGRAGIDFRIGNDQFLGLGVRYMAAEMDFDKTIGKLDLEGPQIVLAYTAYL